MKTTLKNIAFLEPVEKHWYTWDGFYLITANKKQNLESLICVQKIARKNSRNREFFRMKYEPYLLIVREKSIFFIATWKFILHVPCQIHIHEIMIIILAWWKKWKSKENFNHWALYVRTVVPLRLFWSGASGRKQNYPLVKNYEIYYQRTYIFVYNRITSFLN